MVHSGDEHIEAVKLVTVRDPSLDGDIEVIEAPKTQVLHSTVLVAIVVDKRLQIGPGVE